ncbi:MAG: PilT/PilU family type 4a pilus ATPase [Lachnospiraceae bacterium]|nr:PilT/PilU family type 4a pilus ATPase [Lachnospiraceae bacterium]
MDIRELLKSAVETGASDVFIVAGRPVSCRLNNSIIKNSEDRLMPADTESMVKQIYELAGNRDMKKFLASGDDDFAFAIPGLSRFRVNAYMQRGTLSAVVRIITFELPNYQELMIPDSIMEIQNLSKGLVLVTGPAGSGKSTTLSCIVDAINKNQEKHIITLEDPLEYLHAHKKSIISQREISVDTEGYVPALRAALRQSPDVILLGEMRDYETIQIAMTAAETGHLILSTLHTIGAANTIDRIIDAFPAEQQRQIAIQLSLVIRGVVSQQLVPSVDGKMVPAFEIMTVTPAIRNMIRENKVPQIDGIVYSSDTPEMVSMDNSLYRLVKEGKITAQTALAYAVNGEMLARKLGVRAL